MKERECAGEIPAPSLDAVARLALRADSLLFSAARTTDELVQAYRLVYKNYLRCEYIDTHPSEMRYTVFNALPQTTTFVASLGGSVVTTATVIFDSPLGLPLEAIYKDEVDELRSQYARLCEVTMLADRRRAGMRTIPAILQLFKMILHYVLKFEKATDIVITVNPSHETFYTRYLPFEDMGTLRHYPSVKNAPAIAKRVNLAKLMELTKTHKLGEFFMQSPPANDILSAKKHFSEAELREFFVMKRDIFHTLPEFAVEHIKRQYPGHDFDRIMAPVE